MTAKNLRLIGRVQGIGFRAWMVAQAQCLGIAGWVRNRADGSVEALVEGEPVVVEELLRACRRGPRGAVVTEIIENLAEPPKEPGFFKRPTR